MNLGIVMRREVLQDKFDEGRVRHRGVATWNTRRLPTRLTPGWTNRLYVACRGSWRGSFPLSGDVYWNPKDAAAPFALIFDPRRWAPVARALSVVPGLAVSRGLSRRTVGRHPARDRGSQPQWK